MDALSSHPDPKPKPKPKPKRKPKPKPNQVDALSDLGSAYRSGAVAPAVGALEALVRSFDPPAGVAHQACAEMQQASGIASALGGKVADAGATFAGQDSAAWVELNQSLAQVRVRVTVTVRVRVRVSVRGKR